MYCIQSKIGNPTKPIILVLITSMILAIFIGCVFKFAQTKENIQKTSSMPEFSLLENVSFKGFINNSTVIQIENILYSYQFNKRKYSKILTVPSNQKVIITDNYILMFEPNTSFSPKEIYTYSNEVAIYNSKGEFLYKIIEEFSSLFVQNNVLYSVKFNEITNPEQDISSIKTYKLTPTEFTLDRIYSLPYEVIPKSVGNKTYFFTEKYREPITYEIDLNQQTNISEKSNILTHTFLSDQPILINGNLCYLLSIEETSEFSCDDQIFNLDFNPIAVSQTDNELFFIIDSSSENINWTLLNISGIENSMQIIELSIPFPFSGFECKDEICALWNDQTILLINNSMF
ncbi:MAG TPA: hypothetical protein PK957_02900 [Candidatus Dojkabacteria bacterium]|nr:hypothetical protein [Candidatus Dojkabacteria bacterium]